MKTLLLAALMFAPAVFAGDAKPAEAKPAPAAEKKAAGARLEVSVTSAGFVVKDPHPVKAGEPVTLVVTRTIEATCAKDIVVKEFEIKQALPLNKPVEVTFTPKKAGKVHFTCAMNMITGDIVVE